MRIDQRTYSTTALESLSLLGKLIKLARKQRKMTAAELAERAGISRSTLQRVEKGDPKVEIGIVFETAVLLGLPLFDAGQSRLSDMQGRIDDKLMLLPKSVRKSSVVVDDDF